jgi:alpha-glucoside transport system permease protein
MKQRRSPILQWFPSAWSCLLMAPAVVLLMAYWVLPTLWTLYLSFGNGRATEFVGLANYAYVFIDPAMRLALHNNVLWLVFVTGVSVALGLLVAVLVDGIKLEALVKSLIFLPMAISLVGASVIWRFVYAFSPPGRTQIGLLNAVLVHLGHAPIGWLVEQPLNTFALMVIMIWLQTGFCTVLFSAALKGIPTELVEAAQIDGASDWQVFWRITLPMIRSTVLVVTTTLVVVVLKVFDIVFVMTGGNLNTDVVASRMIKEMFTYRHLGRGSALAIVLLLAVVPVIVVNLRRFRQQEEERV